MQQANSMRNTVLTYGKVARALHWSISTLVIVMVLVGYYADYFKDTIPQSMIGTVINLHKLVGLLILFLMLFRLFWALTNPKPILPTDTLPWQRLAERIVHFLLYALLIVMPLSGWIMSSAADKPPHLLGWTMPLPVPHSEEVGGFFWNIHSWLAIVLIAFVAVHVLAALYHHFIKKDNILRRMLGRN